MDKDAREQARQYLLDARKTVESALGRARAAMDDATAREARRLVEEAIEKTGEEGKGKGEGWLSLEDLRQKRGTPKPPARPVDRPAVVETTASTEISLRGLRVDEAEHQLTGALDAAIAGDAPFLRIIHGKGTGALRQLVHELLARDKRVARFAFAPANQGGAGVTVAEFRA